MSEYYCLDLSQIPDAEFTPDTPAKTWMSRAVPSGDEAFPEGSMGALHPLRFYPVQLERVIGFALYFALNVVPLVVLSMSPLLCFFDLPWLTLLIYTLVAYCVVLYVSYRLLAVVQGWTIGAREHGPEAAAAVARGQAGGFKNAWRNQ